MCSHVPDKGEQMVRGVAPDIYNVVKLLKYLNTQPFLDERGCGVKPLKFDFYECKWCLALKPDRRFY
jgi:hypothetical protein